jgi:hypothetical protein
MERGASLIPLDGNHCLFPPAALQAAHPIGALTTMERDAWAKARAELEKDPNNARALKAVDSGIVLPYILPCLYVWVCIIFSRNILTSFRFARGY